MPLPPPIDPFADARRREQAAAASREHHLAIAAMAAQFVLSFVAGAWAARTADDGGNVTSLYAGVACVFALAGAMAASRAVRFAFGSVLALFGIKDVIAKFTTSPPPPPGPPDPREARMEWWMLVLGTGVQSIVLLVLFLLIAVGVAIAGPATFLSLAWRFALGSLVVSLFTWQASKLVW